jgi:TatD DNase family protein
MRLFDTHCHLDDDRLAPEIDQVLARAAEASVTRMATIGCVRDQANLTSALDVAKAHPDRVCATIGVHPHDANALDDALFAGIERVARDPLIVAIGEMGLDYHYDNSPRETQREVFRKQIALARALKKPIVVHSREAREDTLAILREENARDVGGIMHCFSEDATFAKDALDLGFVASFSGIVTFKTATAIQEAARLQPLASLLVETDAPYLAPIPFRGKRNEPAYVAKTAAFIAGLRGMSTEELAEIAYENACRIFGMSAA